jgi:hypothetical protein
MGCPSLVLDTHFFFRFTHEMTDIGWQMSNVNGYHNSFFKVGFGPPPVTLSLSKRVNAHR